MKRTEEIVVNAIYSEFIEAHADALDNLREAKSDLDEVQARFKKIATAVINDARNVEKIFIDDEISEEALVLFETRISETLRIPFKRS